MHPILQKRFLLFSGFRISLLVSAFMLILSSAAFSQGKKEQEEKEKQKVIVEEIVVEAELPAGLPISSTSSIRREKIEALAPRDLSEVLSFTSGTFVSSGSKNESQMKIRGFESQRIALLYDGIPVYEPFFNSFDLKTLTSEEVASIKVVKGASSVLYGPNALGGVVNIITRRPEPPSFSLKAIYDSHDSFSLSSSGAVSWRRLSFAGFASFDKSEGFRWKADRETVLRENSDYDRQNITGKVYFYPGRGSEILFEAAHYRSEFGIPAATGDFYIPRYWRFKSWSRFLVNLGGLFPLGKTGNLKFRTYLVRHDNVLDSFLTPDMNELLWESTYRNASSGAFLLGSIAYAAPSELEFSLNFRNDRVRIQDDRGEEWSEYEHQTLSLGMENHLRLSPQWKLVGGLSVDHLEKSAGEDKTSLNPILGLKFNPSTYVDLHATFSRKSRFPSMKALYSAQTGNPDLRDERGRSYELGLRYEKDFLLAAALFHNRVEDLINPVRLPDGSSANLNVGRARISGFEFEGEKRFGGLSLSVNYTFLEGKNEDEDRPLDLVPRSQLNFVLGFSASFEFTLWGLAVGRSEMKIFNEVVEVPAYLVLHAVLSRSFSTFTVFVRVENLLDRAYATEPGYPMKARTIAAGLRFNLGKRGQAPFLDE